MAAIALQTAVNNILNPVTYAAAAGPDTIAVLPGQRIKLLVKNADASAKTITIVDPRTQFGQASPDVPVIVANGNAGHTEIEIWPEFADPTTGLVTITYSATTSVTVAAVRF